MFVIVLLLCIPILAMAFEIRDLHKSDKQRRAQISVLRQEVYDLQRVLRIMTEDEI
jgi:cell division protein FtsL